MVAERFSARSMPPVAEYETPALNLLAKPVFY
jgi:hypothetical protein